MPFDADVLVVGAGPVGLLMAAELARHGVRSRIIDKQAEPMNWVKALGVSLRTLEVFDDLGIVTEALDAGMLLRRQRVYVNRKQVMDADTVYPDDAPYMYPLSLPQPETEGILREHLGQFGVTIERGVELQSFTQDSDGVLAKVATAGKEQAIRCRYLVGCDGAHSAVRHGMQLPFEGGKFPVEFLLADVAIDWEFSHDASELFMEVPGETLENLLVCIPYKDRAAPTEPRYRISTMAQPISQVNWEEAATAAEKPAADPTLEQMQDCVRHFVPVPATIRDLRWSSVFRISHRLVPKYRVGRAFLAGDAAHIHPPTGGQGMNTGLQDAYNLAWKLALELRGLAAPDLLDSYSAERQPVGQAVVEGTKKRTMNITERSKRDPDQIREDSQLLVNYRGSKWVSESLSRPSALSAGPKPGDRAPDVRGLRREEVEFPLRLFDLIRGTHHTLLVFGAAPAGLFEAIHARYGQLVRVYRIVAPEMKDSNDPSFTALVDADRNFQRTYATGESAAYLIRPDGYIGFRTDALRPDSLNAHFARIFI